MSGLTDLFDRKERRALAGLGLFLILGLSALFFFSLGERRDYFRSQTELAARQKRFAEIDELRRKSKGGWMAWEEARKDIQEVRKNWLYTEQEGIKQLTLDVHKILGESGIQTIGFQYEYLDMKEENLRRVNVSFQVSGTYPALKRLLDEVEKFPKFLMIDRVDFSNSFDEGNRIELRIVMAGYYEKSS